MDMTQGYTREDTLHICHVDLDKLENGTASIVKAEHKTRDEEKRVMVDNRGFFKCIDKGCALHRDFWRLK